MTNTIPFELESLARAKNYQQWIYDLILPHLGDRIFEVGAGIGNMSRWLPIREKLILNEIEPDLRNILTEKMRDRGGNDPRVQVVEYDVLNPPAEFEPLRDIDTIVSFNVLEHIQDDEKFVRSLGSLLTGSRSTKQKVLLTLVPSHQWAYGGMDKEFGHYRRYAKKELRRLHELAMPGAETTVRHFNLVGLLGWFVRGRVMGKKNISLTAIDSFEKLTPFLRKFDAFTYGTLRPPVGQSLIAISVLKN